MLLITGATGHLGSSVVKRLNKITTSNNYILTSSQSSKVDSLASQGYNTRLADFSQTETLPAAFKGIRKLLLISTMDPDRFLQHINVVDAAVHAGVEQIVYTSLAIKNIESSAVKDLILSHFVTEDYILKSGLKYTILRNTMYVDALSQILGDVNSKTEINLPGGTGKVPFALRREMGEGIANLLMTDDHTNKIYASLVLKNTTFKISLKS